MSSDSSLIAQSLYDGRDICSFLPQSDDSLSVVSGQFCGHSYLRLSLTNTWTVFGRVTFQTEFDYISTYTVWNFGGDLLCHSQNRALQTPRWFTSTTLLHTRVSCVYLFFYMRLWRVLHGLILSITTVGMHACMYVCMYVCMSICTGIHVRCLLSVHCLKAQPKQRQHLCTPCCKNECIEADLCTSEYPFCGFLLYVHTYE